MAVNGELTTAECNIDWIRLKKTAGDEFCQNECTVEELSGGESNFTFRITSQKDSSVIVKKAPDYFKCVGPRIPMTKKRNIIEYSTLTLFNKIAPGSVPKPIFCDEEMSYHVMEDLRDYGVLRQLLQHSDASLCGIKDVARYIAKLHRSTHKNNVTEARHREMIELTKHDPLQQLISYYIFEEISRPENIERYSPNVTELYQLMQTDPLIVKNRHTIRTVMDRHDCLIHADFHTSSILVKGDSAKIIDFEFSHVGPAAEDIGHLLANYILSFLEHKFYPSEINPSFHSLLKQAIEKTVELYFDDAVEYLTEDQFTATVAETAGFTGCRLVRRILGRPEMGDRVERSRIELPCLHIGINLTRDFGKITTPQHLIEYLFDENYQRKL